MRTLTFALLSLLAMNANIARAQLAPETRPPTGVEVRSSTAEGYKIRGMLRHGSTVRLLHVRGPWHLVESDELFGYVHGAFLKKIPMSVSLMRVVAPSPRDDPREAQPEGVYRFRARVLPEGLDQSGRTRITHKPGDDFLELETTYLAGWPSRKMRASVTPVKGRWTFEFLNDIKQSSLARGVVGALRGDPSSPKTKKPDPLRRTLVLERRGREFRAFSYIGSQLVGMELLERVKSVKADTLAWAGRESLLSATRKAQDGPTKTTSLKAALEHLGKAYSAAGRSHAWRPIQRRVVKAAGRGAMVLARQLKRDGWEAVYFNPDLGQSRLGTDRNYRGVAIDHQLTNYAPRLSWPTARAERAGTPKDLSGIERLRDVPFYYGIARGGRRAFLGTTAHVMTFEEHLHTSVLGGRDWESGVILVPPGTWRP